LKEEKNRLEIEKKRIIKQASSQKQTQKADDSISSIDEVVNEIDNKISNVCSGISGLESLISQSLTKISETNNRISSIKGKLSDLGNKSKSTGYRFDSYKRALDSEAKKIKDVKSAQKDLYDGAKIGKQHGDSYIKTYKEIREYLNRLESSSGSGSSSSSSSKGLHKGQYFVEPNVTNQYSFSGKSIDDLVNQNYKPTPANEYPVATDNNRNRDKPNSIYDSYSGKLNNINYK
jgi:DNA repair ATPase RecN